MSTTDITVTMEKGTAEVLLNLKSRMATLNMEKRNTSVILKMERGVGRVTVAGYYDITWFDIYYSRQGSVAVDTKLKLQGEK